MFPNSSSSLSPEQNKGVAEAPEGVNLAVFWSQESLNRDKRRLGQGRPGPTSVLLLSIRRNDFRGRCWYLIELGETSPLRHVKGELIVNQDECNYLQGLT